jgi:histidinol dehydrogenase
MNTRLIDWAGLSVTERELLLRRPVNRRDDRLRQTVADIIKRVRTEGDHALFALTEQFDGVKLRSLRVAGKDIARARRQCPQDLISALQLAAKNIRIFHEAQKSSGFSVEVQSGVVCERRTLPLSRVGLYIPAGTAPLVSTLLMLAVPALTAGCPQIALAVPPDRDTGQVNAVILAAASLLGLTEIYSVGGAQAVAALAYGTQSVARVGKIFGPGNAFVTEAKTQVAFDPEGAAIDIPAGPSEVLVIADEYANPDFVAADLLSQAEHDSDSQVVLVATSERFIALVNLSLKDLMSDLPRKNVAAQALAHSLMIKVGSVEDAVAISNTYAPEHLIIQTRDAAQVAMKVTSAGSVFIGEFTPESVGDYASGTNHVLPTNGFARSMSGLGLSSFTKEITFQTVSLEGLRGLAPAVTTLARAEGLIAHEMAVSRRLAVGVSASAGELA